MTSSVVRKYLERYAEPEWRIAERIGRHYAAVLAVPAYRESITLLDGYRAAARNLHGRLLVILVVNAAVGAPEEARVANAELMGALRPSDALASDAGLPPAWRVDFDDFDVLVIDRSSPGFELPRKQGVGMARRIAADVALALWTHGDVACSTLFCSDADVTLPADYFARGLQVQGRTLNKQHPSALLFPFQHVPSGHPELDRATELYDISLRYYVLGLADAGSPYAYQSVGSTLAIDFESYAAVRGFPKREAAEDFYVLDKLAKIGPLLRLSGDPIQVMARWSERVPFGTGRGARDIAERSSRGQAFTLYDPRVFTALRVWLSSLNVFPAHRDVTRLQAEIQASLPEHASTVLGVLESLSAFSELEHAAQAVTNPSVLLRRLHTSFDALRTLRLIHGLRDAAFPNVGWLEALNSAAFTGMKDLAITDASTALDRLLSREGALPARAGVVPGDTSGPRPVE